MTISEMLKSFPDIKAKVESLFSGKATATKEEISELSKQISIVEAGAIAQLEISQKEITKLQTAGASFEASIVTLTADLKAANEKIVGFEPEILRRAGLKAIEIAAAQGIPAGTVKEIPANPAGNKLDVSKLSGLEKAIAVHRSENQPAKN